MVIALIGSLIVLIMIDMPGLLKARNKTKTMIVYFLLISIGFAMSLFQTIDLVSVNPSDVIRGIVDFVLGR